MKLIAKGNTAEIYEYSDNLVCKLFYPEYSSDYIEHEFDNANIVIKLGIRTPRAHMMIFEGERRGIIFDRIIGEDLFRKLYETSSVSFEIWMDKFADFHKQLMKHWVDDAMNYKDFLKMFASDEETTVKINALEEGNCLIHGDFHPANVMVDESNSLVVIDMMNICRGPALYDIARTYFLLKNDTLSLQEHTRSIKSKFCVLLRYFQSAYHSVRFIQVPCRAQNLSLFDSATSTMKIFVICKADD